MKLDFVNAYAPKVSFNGSNVAVASFLENLWPDVVSDRATGISIFWNLDFLSIPLSGRLEAFAIVTATVSPFFWRTSLVHLSTCRRSGGHTRFPSNDS